MAANNTDRIKFIVRGMCHYVSRNYKKQRTGYDPVLVSKEDFYLPKDLKYKLLSNIDYFKNKPYVNGQNHYAEMEDREKHLRVSFRACLRELGDTTPHLDFLRECTLYIMAGVELEQRKFSEAPDIIIDAIYEACINTKQHEELMNSDAELQSGFTDVVQCITNLKLDHERTIFVAGIHNFLTAKTISAASLPGKKFAQVF